MDQKPEFEFKLTTTNNDFKKAFLLTEIVFYTQEREREREREVVQPSFDNNFNLSNANLLNHRHLLLKLDKQIGGTMACPLLV